jgi:hypothetical protein
LLREGPDEQRNVLAPLPQGRDSDREDIQAVVEVISELPVGDQ